MQVLLISAFENILFLNHKLLCLIFINYLTPLSEGGIIGPKYIKPSYTDR